MSRPRDLKADCPPQVFQTQLPEEYQGYKTRKEILFNMIEQGMPRECMNYAVMHWFGIAPYEKARNYVSKYISEYNKEKARQSMQEEDEAGEEQEPEEKKEEKAEALKMLKVTQPSIEAEEEEPEEAEEPEPGPEPEAPTEAVEVDVDEEDITNLYGASLEFLLKVNGIDADLEEFIPENRISRTGRYLYKLMKKYGLLEHDKIIDLIGISFIAQDIALVMSKIKEYKKRKRLGIKPEKEKEQELEEKKEEAKEEMSEDEFDKIVKQKARKAWG